MLVFGLTPRDVVSVLDTGGDGRFGSDPTYLAATEELPTGDGVFFLNVRSLVEQIRAALPPDALAGIHADVVDQIEPIIAIAAGSDSSPDVSVGRAFLLVDVGEGEPAEAG
jgi:hypothetical protein